MNPIGGHSNIPSSSTFDVLINTSNNENSCHPAAFANRRSKSDLIKKKRHVVYPGDRIPHFCEAQMTNNWKIHVSVGNSFCWMVGVSISTLFYATTSSLCLAVLSDCIIGFSRTELMFSSERMILNCIVITGELYQKSLVGYLCIYKYRKTSNTIIRSD